MPTPKSYKLRIREKMAKAAVNFSKDNEYYTPKEIVSRFGQFEYDPATTPEKAAEFGVKEFDTIETDGLTKDWTKYRRIWCNPPFTHKHEFLNKACETYRQTHADIYFLFPVEFTTTKRFHETLGELGGGYFTCQMEESSSSLVLERTQKAQRSGVWCLGSWIYQRY